MRNIPPSGINLFQLIYILLKEYQDQSGLEPLNLSLGNPDTIPSPNIRKLKGKMSQSEIYDCHTYSEDRNLNSLCEGMVRLHSGLDLTCHNHLKALPIAGIKSATAILPLACAMHLESQKKRSEFILASTLPSYDVIGTWNEKYLGARRIVWPLCSDQKMQLRLEDLKSALKKEKPDLIFVIRPGNPSATGNTRKDWEELIAFCLEKGSRLVNDGAYAGLQRAPFVTLAEVAQNYPELEWLEMYSVSKTFSDPGARVGVAVGSRDFIDDLTLIKGNMDSGPPAALEYAYGEFLKDEALARKEVNDLISLYQKRLDFMIPMLQKAGLQPACETHAGFFTLWKVPQCVLGVDLCKDKKYSGLPRSEAFNRLVIEKTGIVGVHFEGCSADGQNDPLIRYAVCTDVLDRKFQERFEEGLSRLKPVYEGGC